MNKLKVHYITFLSKGEPIKKDFNSMYDYHYFAKSRELVLNLVQPSNFDTWLNC
jgi:hypothetical protein